MNSKYLFVVGFCVAAFCGCLTEQERKEYARAQALVSEVQNCLSTGDYQKATQLCDQGEKECPSVDYDWREAKAAVVAHKKAAEDARTAMVVARKKRLEDSWNQMAVLNALNVIEQCKDKYGRNIGTMNPHRITVKCDSYGNVKVTSESTVYDLLGLAHVRMFRLLIHKLARHSWRNLQASICQMLLKTTRNAGSEHMRYRRCLGKTILIPMR